MMIRDIVNQYKLKKQREKNLNQNNDEGFDKGNKNSKKKPVAIFDKYINYVDNLLGIVSVWITILLLSNAFPYLQSKPWYFYVIGFILLYILTDFTVKKLRPLIFIGIIIGGLYLIIELALDIKQDSINPTKTDQTINFGNEEALNSIITKLSIGTNEPLERKLDSLEEQNNILNTKQSQLELKLDSLLKMNESSPKETNILNERK